MGIGPQGIHGERPTTKKRKVVLRDNPDCSRGLIVEVAGREVASANYDDHGWSGIDAVEGAAVGVARAFGIAVDDRRTR